MLLWHCGKTLTLLALLSSIGVVSAKIGDGPKMTVSSGKQSLSSIHESVDWWFSKSKMTRYFSLL